MQADTPSSEVSWVSVVLRRIQAALDQVNRLLALVAAGLLIFVLFLTLAEILSRKILNMPIFGVVDMVSQAMVGIAVLGLAYCQREDANIKMDLLVNQLRGTPYKIVRLFALVVFLATAVAYCYGATIQFGMVWSFGGTTSAMRLPIWVTHLAVVSSFGLLVVQLALQIALLLIRPKYASDKDTTSGGSSSLWTSP